MPIAEDCVIANGCEVAFVPEEPGVPARRDDSECRAVRSALK